MDKENLEVVLPDVKKRSGFLVYLKVIFLPFMLFAIVFCGYLGYIDLKVSIVELSLITCIFLIALIFAKYNAEYTSSIFEQQKDEFKQALKRYIMKNFLTIGKETKCNASFDDFALSYMRDFRNENFSAIASAIFPLLGILGTFISMAFYIPSFTNLNASSLEQDMSRLLSGVASAFYICIYGVFLSLWWIFFERFGKIKIQVLLDRQKNATSSFFWSKEELRQRYLEKSSQHFDKIAIIFEQVSNEDFFKELDHSIERKFGLFQEMLNVEEKAIRVSSEHIKQSMTELSRAHRNQRDLSKVYLEMTNNISTLNQNFKDISSRMAEQYNRLLDVSQDRISHLDKTLLMLDERIDALKKNFESYQISMLENQEKVFSGFKNALIHGMREFKEIYEEEKSIDDKIDMMTQLRQEMSELDNEASEVIAKLVKEDKSQKKEEDARDKQE